ncbi:hypothetical protein [Pseudomonas citronellolis]|uniref:Uncharacterized protein n=1 Tax=Pseudomonas citronellolis TaxID=53408 RepID=A0AAW6NZG2_9PSED|nr:hypothetical protein [Pseudomonas citronellolis]MDF3840493.1 hypothetical protein [Pseudomonas citronellolis]WRT82934.1 hypothetical protein VK748_00415 [Pseudomonas citronellolis]
MANVEHVLSGAGAPTAAPPSISAHYVDTVSGAAYISTGTSNASDWRLLYEDTGWQLAEGLNDFQYPPECRRLNGVVYLRGLSWVSTEFQGQYVAQLPEGFAPFGQWRQFVRSNSNEGRQFEITISGSDSDSVPPEDVGKIMVTSNFSAAAGSDYVDFRGISFPVG